MTYTYEEMSIADYDQALALWNDTEGLALSDADTKLNIGSYLTRNPGMSYVCKHGPDVIGTILCGHDGRRGYIYHVAVHAEHRGQAIGRHLVARSLKRLRREGMTKCHIMVIADNEIGNRFWTFAGWQRRDGILLFSSETGE